MKRPYIFVILFLFMTVFQFFVFLYVMSDYDKQRTQFEITDHIFVDAVERGVSNFLSRISVGTEICPASESHFVMTDPNVVLVDELSSWETFSGVAYCMINGITYGVGDYSPYGLVTKIVGSRVYCTSSNVVSIIRARRPDRALASDKVRPGAVPDDGAL